MAETTIGRCPPGGSLFLQPRMVQSSPLHSPAGELVRVPTLISMQNYPLLTEASATGKLKIILVFMVSVVK